MPRAFNDEDVVMVNYKTRSDHLTFLGKVIGYDSPNRKYIVHTLAHTDGYYRVTQDLFISCHKYELRLATGADVQDIANQQRLTLSKTAKEWEYCKDNKHNYRGSNTDKGLFYTSFALQRIKDKDFNRKFLVSTAIERNKYVSWL